ncbi:TetR/AcrR family transcriptional regulator [Lutibacter sp.]|uniref:TetR/AcrR family transcriptional regulator n=1 Tax=Lutibacter sp. TaxID=1925666 RepID=UPI0025C0E4B5|nr:TetR/AcrR family transcriptional regulator [Lutibacter sp.]MCF6182919.1 TetR/AcrR family transcriptional regulator [Lutibacter sp.]
MARKIDDEKIKRIKEATMQTIVENGIEDTTIAMIAKNANVSGGYLYRIYKGKQDLINELFFEKANSLYQELEFLLSVQQNTIESFINSFIQNRIIYFINEPIASKFYYQLLHNENFALPKDLRIKTLHVMETIKAIGLKSGEISENISLYQLHYHLFVYVIDYIHFKRKNIFGLKESINEDLPFLTQSILKIFKQ